MVRVDNCYRYYQNGIFVREKEITRKLGDKICLIFNNLFKIVRLKVHFITYR